MKDNVVIGAGAGAIGGLVGLILSYTIYSLGISPISSLNVAASLVVIDVLNLTTGGIIWSIATHLFVAQLFGLILTYFLIFTGKEYWGLKGIGTGAIFCLVAHSFLIPLIRTDALVRSLNFNPSAFGTILITHATIGLVTAFLIIKFKFKPMISSQ